MSWGPRHWGKGKKVSKEDTDTSSTNIDDEDLDEDDDDLDDDDSPSCYSWCGNPAYPNCIDSCSVHDD